MKRSTLPSILIFISTGLTFGVQACQKQGSQQPSVNSVQESARHDVAQQASAGPDTGSAEHREQVTTNPNSGRDNPDTTLGTQRGASLVNGANMNPNSATNIPTSVDTSVGEEPMSDAAVDRVNCRDAIANDYDGHTVAMTNTCPSTARSRIKSGATDQQATR